MRRQRAGLSLHTVHSIRGFLRFAELRPVLATQTAGLIVVAGEFRQRVGMFLTLETIA